MHRTFRSNRQSAAIAKGGKLSFSAPAHELLHRLIIEQTRENFCKEKFFRFLFVLP